MKHAYTFFYERNGRSWPTEITIRELLSAGERAKEIIASYEAIQETKVHLKREKSLVSLEELKTRPNLEETLPEGNIHLSTTNLYCSVYTKRKDQNSSDNVTLWISGIMLGIGIVLAAEREYLYASLPLLTGIVGTAYGWKEQRDKSINHLEIKVLAKHIYDPRRFESILKELKALQM